MAVEAMLEWPSRICTYAESLVMSGWEQVRPINWRFPAVLSHPAASRSPHNYGLSGSESTTTRERQAGQDVQTPRFAIMLLTDGCRSASDRLKVMLWQRPNYVV